MKSFLVCTLLIHMGVFVSLANGQSKGIQKFYQSTGELFDLKPQEKTFVPFYVPLVESLAFPGGGHVSNGHISKSFMTLATTGVFLGLGIPKLLDSDNKKNASDAAMAGYGNVFNVLDKRGFDAARLYYGNQSEYLALLLMATFGFLDSVAESIILFGREEEDDTSWLVGSPLRLSGYKSSATTNNDALNSLKSLSLASGEFTHTQTKTPDAGVPGAMVGVEGGRISQKRFVVDLSSTSGRLQYEWWFGLPLSKYGLSSESIVWRNLAPTLGFRWITYDLLLNNSSVANNYTNNAANKFSLSSLDFHVGAVWKKGLRQKFKDSPRFIHSLAGGLGFFFLSLGTSWSHPTSDDSGTGVGSAGGASPRAGKRGFMGSYGLRGWATGHIWKMLNLNLEFEYFIAKESQAPASAAAASKLTLWQTQVSAVAKF